MSEVHVFADESPITSPPTSLASRLASRICHDLISPLGAIANGVELLVLSGTERTPEIDLISESVESANARLRFFRLAYGAAGAQPIGRSEIVRILSALARGSRHEYAWLAEGEHPRIEVKAVFLLIQCLETALPLGGHLTAERHAGRWIVAAHGSRLRADRPGWRLLKRNSEAAAEDASDVQFVLLAEVLDQLGREFDITTSTNRIEACF